MSALAGSRSNRTIGLATPCVLASFVAAGAVWHFALLRHDLVNIAHQLPSWGSVSLVIFVAASISSTVGFAFSAIAAGMVLHFVADTVEAVQIMMIASIAIQAYSVAGLWRTISWRACAPFLIGGIATMPAGIYVLLSLRPHAYAMVMGVALYGAFMLFRQPPSIKRGGLLMDIGVGALGGLTGPLAAFPGVFVTIWCGMRGWDKVVQRSIYQPYILVLQMVTLGGLSLVGERSVLDGKAVAYALPGLAGAYLGLHVFKKLTDLQFQRLVNFALILSGIILAIK
jgi:uncharacterized membrane protein YfcA